MRVCVCVCVCVWGGGGGGYKASNYDLLSDIKTDINPLCKLIANRFSTSNDYGK